MEETLIAAAGAPLSLFTRDADGSCGELRFIPAAPDRTRFTSLLGPLSLHGGSLFSPALRELGHGSFHLHGQSERSLLTNGHELFFDRARCLTDVAAGTRSAPRPRGWLDAAALFWSTQRVYYVPALNGRTVTCQRVELPPPERPRSFAIEQDGRRAVYLFRQRAEGIEVQLAWGAAQAEGYPVLPVHGFDEDSFYLAGSRWFVSAGACAARGAGSKPVNFGAHHQLRGPDEALVELADQYFTREAAAGADCYPITVERLGRTRGRLRFERPSGARERDYDLYPLSLALWLGPVHEAAPLATDRMSGELLWLEPLPAGLRVGDGTWFGNLAACAASQPSPPPEPSTRHGSTRREE